MGAVTPQLTVLMPVKNGSGFLRPAIQSVLKQTFVDFELLVIDDASTDDSVAIIRSFADPRIRLIHNKINLGVACSLNKGIELARGDFIARMDADDICLPDRFQKQMGRFSGSPEAAVVATWVTLIDSAGEDVGIWDCDRSASTCDEIYRHLPRLNCLAHPSVMMRKEVIDRYSYRDTRIHSEDYDLWLRLAADNVRIEKVEEPLLKYRVHSGSVTSLSNVDSYGLKDIRAKASYLRYRLCQLKRLNRFDLQVAGCLMQDVGKLVIAKFQLRLRSLARKLLLAVGRFCSVVSRQPEPRLFFFFPFYHTGGAEQVHADIVAAVAEQKPWVIFTNRSKGSHFKERFRKSGHLLEPCPWLENAVTRIICLGYFAALINRKENARVLGANTLLFYELLPYLDDHVQCIDLIHAFGGGLEEVSLPHVARLDRRVVINRKTLADLKEQYAANGIGQTSLERISLIENAVVIPADFQRKKRGERLKVLYVGRGSVEKRVHLVGEMVKICRARELSVDFTLVGDVVDSMSFPCRDYCTMVGEVTDASELERYYREHDLLLVTSRSEGFPLAIMEAMAHGVVPASTDVGGISTHVVDGVTGFLIPGGEAEEEITDLFVDLLSRLAHDRFTLEEMSGQAYRHALEHFGFDRFNRAYRQLLVDSQDQEMG